MLDLRIGVDIGGTFTDFAIYDPSSGGLEIGKVLTSADDPSVAVIDGIAQMLGSRGVDLSEVGDITHATTIATNTVIQRKGLPTGLITTRGFRDVLLIGRQKRWDLYDNYADRPVPLVPREHIFEVPERMLWDGTVETTLDEDAVRDVARRIQAAGLTTIAVCLIHSYANPAHERRIAEILREVAPDLMVSLSSDVSPLYREYERTSTSVMNAYVMPVVNRYVERLDHALAEGGFERRMLIMQSNGGVATTEVVRRYPIRIIESGPAAGVLTTMRFAPAAGTENLISFDMGGTTAKLCLIEDGRPALTSQFEVDMVKLKKASGLPISITAIDLIEIGSGGGSLASVQNGAIVVGPESAGSKPGPACYGLGGTRPTVTDADLLLGYLDPAHFLGGAMALDAAAAEAAIRRHVADPLGMSPVEAAWGVHEVVTAQMAQAARAVTISRGKDPRGFALVPFGGAGPVHGARLARMLGCRKLLFARSAGVMSAVGLLMAEPAFDLARTQILEVGPDTMADVNALYAELEAQGRRQLAETGAHAGIRLTRSCDMHFVGQGYELTVDLPGGKYTAESVEVFRSAFFAAYAKAYGDRTFDRKWPLAGVHWRLRATAQERPVFAFAPIGDDAADPAGARKGQRPAWFPETGGFTDCPVYDRYRLRAGHRIEGPAIIEERESTIVLPPGSAAWTDDRGNILAELD
jgi:N-methylhydantoinase A